MRLGSEGSYGSDSPLDPAKGVMTMSYPRLRAIAAALALASVSGGASAFQAATTPLAVRANVVDACTVQTNLLDFGNVQSTNFLPLPVEVNSVGGLTVNCSLGLGWTVTMGTGLGAGASIVNRKLTGPGGATINYNIAQNLNDANSSLWWGDGSPGTSTLTAIGNASDQLFNIFGRIFSGQPVTAPGGYSDTVLVTITF